MCRQVWREIMVNYARRYLRQVGFAYTTEPTATGHERHLWETGRMAGFDPILGFGQYA